MITKYKCNELLWFIDDNKIKSQYVSQINQTRWGGVDYEPIYIFTKVPGFTTINAISKPESEVFKSKKKLIKYLSL